MASKTKGRHETCPYGDKPMKHYDPDIHKRRSIRLKAYDYSQPGAYFVTICVNNKESIFGEIKGGIMYMNDAGRTVESLWYDLQNHYPNILLDAFIVMPNHVHGIIVINDVVGASLVDARKPDGVPNKGQARDLPLQEQINDSNVGVPLVGTLNTGDSRNIRANTRVAPTLCDIVGAFKSKSTNEYITGVKQSGWMPFEGKLWQRNYYDHIIRNEVSLEKTREYIVGNPMEWGNDDENPDKE